MCVHTPLQIRRAERGEQQLDMTRRKLQTMLNATEYRDVASVLDAQGGALFHLGAIGELLVPNFPFQVSSSIIHHACPTALLIACCCGAR
jgi:hypothetical protein